MKRTFVSLAAIMLLIQSHCLFAQSHSTGSSKYVIMGYIGSKNWTKEDILATKMTHIIYAFANLTQNGVLAPASVKDSTNLAILNTTKDENKALKILISVGGWGGCKYFSDASLTAESRAKFIASALAFIEKFKLDGIDIDWEYPAQIGAGNIYRPEDKQNFTLLMKEFRAALDEQAASGHHQNYLLTAAMGVDTAYMNHTEVGPVSRYLDYVNIMTYDIYNGNDKVTGHQSNLYQSKYGHQVRVSAADAIQNFIKAGVPANKIVMGLPFYGRGWTMVNDQDRGLYQPSAGHHFSLPYDSLENSYINKNGFERFWDKKSKVPYLWNSKVHTFVTYNDVRSFKYKTRYVKKNNLAGVMFWEYTEDLKKQGLFNPLVKFMND
ncbi:glycoside hydrolase family 18 protein [Mucilaginibacter sp.]|uniref:glycoside hydrolase family 18 protein n=1 Tax=Mucilaginibacter sp. TaxID=1882438 RepID=UPI00262EE2D9|nr:glycoside hydrolase family 18 protein [Mucilaginibacter sp.]MDB4921814.1 chitinase [Mucilaginibacter sp.]